MGSFTLFTDRANPAFKGTFPLGFPRTLQACSSTILISPPAIRRGSPARPDHSPISARGGVSRSSNALRKFVSKALEQNRITFGDLRRLERTVLPAGITSRIELRS